MAWVIDLVRREYYKYLYWSDTADTGQIGSTHIALSRTAHTAITDTLSRSVRPGRSGAPVRGADWRLLIPIPYPT